MRRALLAFEPPDGGVAENVAQLALGLREHGWLPAVAGPPEATIYPRLEAAGIEYWRLPFSRGFADPVADARGLRGLRQLLGERRFDLVHAHSSKAGALLRLAVRGRVPTVYSPHCFAFIGEVGGLQRGVATWTERALARYTGAFLCVCEDERRQALSHRVGRPPQLRLVYNGVEPCPGAAPAPELAALGPAARVVGAIAVLRRQKRLDLLIDAAPAILAADPDAHVVIIGSGPEEESLRRHAADRGLDREPRFHFVPFHDSSWPFLAALEVFVLPSQWEAFPIGLLEALACGVPQVATDVGGNAEAVADGVSGRVVGVEAGEIGAAVAELLGDREALARMGEASRHRRDELFTIERMVAATAAVYDELAPPEGGG